MFERIFIERELKDHPRAQEILARFKNTPVKEIERVEEIFGRVKKPYLQKRESLQLFLAQKRGPLVKEAPAAYGQAGDPHYYYIHAYNCIYECTYCYLQGYFHSPDLVLFLNHEEILKEIEQVILNTPSNQTPWFHAGEYSDSLALSHLTGELPLYYDFFRQYPQARLELRTKSANVKEIMELPPLNNVTVSFSITPAKDVKEHDLKTPPLKARLSAMKKLADHGHRLGLHFDPIIWSEHMMAEYEELLNQIKDHLSWDAIDYLSLGVVRFTKDVYHQVEKNYPDSPFLKSDFVKSFDGKVRYMKAQRAWMLGGVQNLALSAGLSPQKIYLCMEDEA